MNGVKIKTGMSFRWDLGGDEMQFSGSGWR